jgi:hypothetical protein
MGSYSLTWTKCLAAGQAGLQRMAKNLAEPQVNEITALVDASAIPFITLDTIQYQRNSQSLASWGKAKKRQLIRSFGLPAG